MEITPLISQQCAWRAAKEHVSHDPWQYSTLLLHTYKCEWNQICHVVLSMKLSVSKTKKSKKKEITVLPASYLIHFLPLTSIHLEAVFLYTRQGIDTKEKKGSRADLKEKGGKQGNWQGEKVFEVWSLDQFSALDDARVVRKTIFLIGNYFLNLQQLHRIIW